MSTKATAAQLGGNMLMTLGATATEYKLARNLLAFRVKERSYLANATSLALSGPKFFAIALQDGVANDVIDVKLLTSTP